MNDNKINVLCVEDEALLLENLVKQVAAELPGARIDQFQRASEAERFVRECEGPLHIAFLDINMRGINGMALARGIQERFPKVNIVFCTGYDEYALDALDINCSGYLMKPITKKKIQKAIETLRFPLPEATVPKVEFTCFGNFECRINGEIPHFKYNKTKNLLAYLVDRNGSSCTIGELSAVLFEDDTHSSYLSKLRADLLAVFRRLGAEDAIIARRGMMGINKEAVTCDYYDFLDGSESARKAFMGEYMSQYSFAEQTLGYLLRM